MDSKTGESQMEKIDAQVKCLELAFARAEEHMASLEKDIERVRHSIKVFNKVIHDHKAHRLWETDEMRENRGFHLSAMTDPHLRANGGVGPVLEIGCVGIPTYLPERCTCRDGEPCRYCQIYGLDAAAD